MDTIKPDKYITDSPIDQNNPILPDQSVHNGSKSTDIIHESENNQVDVTHKGETIAEDQHEIKNERVSETIHKGTQGDSIHLLDTIHDNIQELSTKSEVLNITDGSITQEGLGELAKIHNSVEVGSTEHKLDIVSKSFNELDTTYDIELVADSAEISDTDHKLDIIQGDDPEIPNSTLELIKEGTQESTEHKLETIAEGSTEDNDYQLDTIHEGEVGSTKHSLETIQGIEPEFRVHELEEIAQGSISDSTYKLELIATNLQGVTPEDMYTSDDLITPTLSFDVNPDAGGEDDTPIDLVLPIFDIDQSFNAEHKLDTILEGTSNSTEYQLETVKDGTVGGTNTSLDTIKEGTSNDTDYQLEVIKDGTVGNIDPSVDQIKEGNPNDLDHQLDQIKEGTSEPADYQTENIVSGDVGNTDHELELIAGSEETESNHKLDLIKSNEVTTETHELETIHEGDPNIQSHDLETIKGQEPTEGDHELETIHDGIAGSTDYHTDPIKDTQNGVDNYEGDSEDSLISESQNGIEDHEGDSEIALISKSTNSNIEDQESPTIKAGDQESINPENQSYNTLTIHDANPIYSQESSQLQGETLDVNPDQSGEDDTPINKVDNIKDPKDISYDPSDTELLKDNQHQNSESSDTINIKDNQHENSENDTTINIKDNQHENKDQSSLEEIYAENSKVGSVDPGQTTIGSNQGTGEVKYNTSPGKVHTVAEWGQVPFVGDVIGLATSAYNSVVDDVTSLLQDKRYQVYTACQLIATLLKDKVYGSGGMSPTQAIQYLNMLKGALPSASDVAVAAVKAVAGLITGKGLKFDLEFGPVNVPERGTVLHGLDTQYKNQKHIKEQATVAINQFFEGIEAGGYTGLDDRTSDKQQFYDEFKKVMYTQDQGNIVDAPESLEQKELNYWDDDGNYYLAPLQGYKTIAGFSLDSSHLWDISFRRYTDEGTCYVPPPPSAASATESGWVPALSYDFDDFRSESKTVESPMGYDGFKFPQSRTKPCTFSMQILDNQFGHWSEWLRQIGRLTASNADSFVAPYKCLCYEMDLYILDVGAHVRYLRRLLVSLDDPENKYSGEEDPSVVTYNTNWRIVGELSTSRDAQTKKW